jgi:hypothetical protein
MNLDSSGTSLVMDDVEPGMLAFIRDIPSAEAEDSI